MTSALPNTSPVAPAHPALGATAADAAAHFAAKLRFETDPSDLAAAVAAGDDVVVVDSRGNAAWAQGRIPGALHLPTARIAGEAGELIPAGTPVVVYCWSPGCNGGTKAALAFAELGYPVRELIGGFEYWAREGFEVETDAGIARRAVDPLTGPVPSQLAVTAGGPVCDC